MENRIKEVLSKLTLEEKAALCSGVSSWETTPIDRVGIPSVFVADGPHGVRKEQIRASLGNVFQKSVPSTCFPPAVTLAATWDRDLVYNVGKAIGEECLDQEVQTVLGPGINIKRNPMCGRNFEYFSEDPCLTGELAASYINGVQSTGVGTSLKHYAVNSQEYRRMTSDSQVDERALREIYLAAFETAVKKAQPATIMASYNLINGEYACENKKILWDILREEWGFKGIVISDWGAVNDRVKGIAAGLNIEMPSSNGIRDAEIVSAVQSGRLSEERLDEVLAGTLEYIFKYAKVKEDNKGYKADYEAHHELARKAAASGAVLLKNKGGILPVKSGKSVAVVGELAKHLRYQGSGSSRINPRKIVSFTQCLDNEGIAYEYAAGYSIKNDKIIDDYIAEACEAAKGKDYVLAFIGLTDPYESESFDREHINLPPAHNALIEELSKHNENVIVVISAGSPVTMPWLDKVKAVINVYLGGQAGGEAAYDVLWGNVNPSGKLPETYPLSINDVLSTLYFGNIDPEYRESIYVGYRYFDTARKPVLFPFGYGLSYTTFKLSDIRVSQEKFGAEDTLKVTVKVTNTGKAAGAEVVQLYVSEENPVIFVPEKQLRNFQKVYLEAGESKDAELELSYRDFAFYNVEAKDWTAAPGKFELLVGTSSRDIKLRKTVELVGEPLAKVPDYKAAAPAYYDIAAAAEIPVAQFEALLGRPVNEPKDFKNSDIGFNTAVGDFEGRLFRVIFRSVVKKFSTAVLSKDATDTDRKMVRLGAMDLPVRNMYAMSAGALSYEAVLGLMDMLNGHFFRGLVQLIKGMKNKAPLLKAEKYLKD
ncbi:MAG TPA: glycoside hydrolase family 3 C-terminal domain-containing protein [Clostridia bacterium]|nr:glycoside hydrolase family 3 C-terminal domain-containing protein [Clostridia bacterium]